MEVAVAHIGGQRGKERESYGGVGVG